MTQPKRIQRKRTRGWKMPPNTVYVGRPSKWGNPFVVGTALCDCDYDYDEDGESTGIPAVVLQMSGIEVDDYLEQEITTEDSLALYRAHILYKWEYESGWNPRQLRGKDLACWCSLDRVCHADVLLDVANRELPLGDPYGLFALKNRETK